MSNTMQIGTPIMAISDSVVELVFAMHFYTLSESGNLLELPLSQIILVNTIPRTL